jgi:integrase
MRNTRISEKHSILNGRAEIYRTRDSGDVWQFRQYDPATRKHHRKSLRTRDLHVAISAAEQLAQEIGGAEKATSRKTRISAQHKVLDGLAEIYRTSVSGDVWQFRMYFQEEQRHFRKSLKTRDLESALERARRLGADLMGKHRQGIKIFGVSLQELVDEYIAYRQREVDLGIMEGITAGRLGTIKSQLRHLLDYKGAATKAAELERDSLFDWRMWRKTQKRNVSDVTIRNEQATINAVAKFAYRKGILHFDRFNFETLRIRQSMVGKRDTFKWDEYQRLYDFMREWAVPKKGTTDASEHEILERLLIRDYVLISANAGLRVGEIRQLRWGDVDKIEVVPSKEKGGKSHLVHLTVRAETSKVRQERKIIVRGGEYFTRLRDRQEHTGKNDLVFARIGGDGTETLDHRVWKRRWYELMDGIGIEDHVERKLTWYSLRHWMITQRIASGVDVVDLAKITGTSISHIEQTYLKYSQEMAREAAMKSHRFTEDGGIERF